MQKGSKDYLDVLSGQEVKDVHGFVTDIKAQTHNWISSVDLIQSYKTLRISDDRCERAKDHIKAASKILLAYDQDHFPIKLTPAQQRRILEFVQELLDGKRESVMFQINKEGTKVKEMFSREVL